MGKPDLAKEQDKTIDTKEKPSAGMHLLKKGQSGVFRLVFSRMSIVLGLLLFNIAMLLAVFSWFEELLPLFYGASTVLVAAMVIYLINSSMDASASASESTHRPRCTGGGPTSRIPDRSRVMLVKNNSILPAAAAGEFP